jgi:hypothetical protein
MSEVIDEVIKHLEFFGYEVKQIEGEEDLWVATNGSKPENISISIFSSCILFRTAYQNEDGFTSDDANRLNKLFLVTRCVVHEVLGVSLELATPLNYDKKSFGALFEEYKGEIREFLDFATMHDSKEE